MYKVAPAISSRLSRLPAWRPGGLLLRRPISAAGATPMLPKNGRSGMTIPGANSAVMCWRSSAMIFAAAPGSQFSGNTPLHPL